MVKNRRFYAIVFSILIVSTLLFSVMFVAVKTNHDCIGEDCPVCHSIQSCVQTLRTLNTVVVTTIVILAVDYSLVRITLPHVYDIILRTLVSLKVKLTN